MGDVIGAIDDPRPSAPPGRPHLVVAAGRHGRRFHQSRTFDVLVAVGLITYGIVHLLIAWIAVRIAWTGRQGNDSQDAALDAMAQTVYGEALLWMTALGLAALTLWQVFETIWRRTPEEVIGPPPTPARPNPTTTGDGKRARRVESIPEFWEFCSAAAAAILCWCGSKGPTASVGTSPRWPPQVSASASCMKPRSA